MSTKGGREIKYFMWGYQSHFRISQELFAERIFQALDRRFEPELFLVGILPEKVRNGFPACVEPEQDFWIHSEKFEGVPVLAESLVTQYPEAGMLQSHPLARQWQDEALFHRSLRDAIWQTIGADPSKPTDLYYSVSLPAKVEHYHVCVVLGLQRVVLDSYHALKQCTVRMHEHRHVSVAVSLIDACSDQFLENARQELLKPDPGLSHVDGDAEEIIRAAGHKLCLGLVWRFDQDRLAGMRGLFRACTTISSLRYEHSASAGRMILARRDHPAIERKVSFAEPARLSRYRAARKLFQIASGNLALHSDSEEIYGLGTLREYNVDEEDLFEVHMLGHHHWELTHGEQTLMRVRYGVPELPRLSFDEQKLRQDLPRIFRSIAESAIEKLVTLVRAAERESHGTLLLITENAPSEAQRLGGQGTPIAPCPLTPGLLEHLTPIDGAILLTPNAVCHGIGTILNGRATGSGDAGRGARFNSAVRYVESEWPCLAIVVSEDGGVDFVPDLLPVARRSTIAKPVLSGESRAIGR